MKSAYNDNLMTKYGIDDDAAEIITELKKRIRKVSPLTKEQKEACEVCDTNSSFETIYNHHIMKVEYLAILVYYYDLYKKERNPNYVPNRGTTQEEINTQSDKEFIYVLKKDKELYIPRVGICERHHNMIHELAEDYEGSTNKGLLSKAKPRELKELYEIFAKEDMEIYKHIFDEDESLDGREYYISYLKIWNDTLGKAMENLHTQVDYRLDPDRYPEELSKKNKLMLEALREQIISQENEAKKALDCLNPQFDLEGEVAIDVNSFDSLDEDNENIDANVDIDDKETNIDNADDISEISISELFDDETLKGFSIEMLESMYKALMTNTNVSIDSQDEELVK